MSTNRTKRKTGEATLSRLRRLALLTVLRVADRLSPGDCLNALDLLAGRAELLPRLARAAAPAAALTVAIAANLSRSADLAVLLVLRPRLAAARSGAAAMAVGVLLLLALSAHLLALFQRVAAGTHPAGVFRHRLEGGCRLLGGRRYRTGRITAGPNIRPKLTHPGLDVAVEVNLARIHIGAYAEGQIHEAYRVGHGAKIVYRSPAPALKLYIALDLLETLAHFRLYGVIQNPAPLIFDDTSVP